MRALLGLLVCGALGCGPSIPKARTTVGEAPSPRELESARRVANRRCSTAWGLLAPGLGHACLGRSGEAAALLALTGAELATAITAAATIDGADAEHPAVLLPIIGLQDLWVYEFAATSIEKDRAAQRLFAPQDTLAELAVAPFNVEVMKQPHVWLGIAGTLAAGIAVSALVDEDLTTERFGDDVNLFGEQVSPALGYPAGALALAGLFEHVAIAEEALFRGVLQSQLARTHGETEGWIYGSLIFGGVHALNALGLDEDERVDYLLIGVPFITVLGSYLGLSYRWTDYSLASPVAIHFWYDFLLSATFFAMNPQDSPLSARIAIPF